MVDELERQLAQALASDADRRPVEVADLLGGARSGARRIRRRRTTGVAVLAALVVAAVPLGSLALGGDGASQVASTPVPSNPAPSPEPTVLAEPTKPQPTTPQPTPPTESPVNPDVPAELVGTVLIPPEAMLAPADLPFTPTATNDYGPYLKNRTMVTSLCSDTEEPGDALAVGGRQIGYVGAEEASVSTTARVFSGDGAAQQLAFLRASLGTCDYAVTYTPQDPSGLPGDEALVGTAPSAFLPGGTQVIGTVRDGNTTVGIQTDVTGDAQAAVWTARDLLTRAHERLEASGLPAAHPG